MWDSNSYAYYEDRYNLGILDAMELRARFNQVWIRDNVFKNIPGSDFNNNGVRASLPANVRSTDKHPISNMSSVNGRYATLARDRISLWFYYYLMEQVDGQIGQVLDALENSKFKDNTLIVFTSDHGEMGISHGLTAKNLPYEESARVPLIFAGNGIPEGVIDLDTPVNAGFDMLPTILKLMELDIPAQLHGISLANKITKGEEINRKYLYLESVNSYGVLEDGRYKYTRFVNTRNDGTSLHDNPYILDPNQMIDGRYETLFDLDPQKDPDELINLAHDPTYAAKLTQLRTALQAELTLRGININI